MPRTLSNTATSAVHGEATAEIFIMLLTLDHADLAEPIRVSSDNVDTVSRGNTFIAFPFDFQLPNQDDEIPESRLVIDNVDRSIVTAIRSISSAPTIKTEIVLHSDPDTVEAALPDFKLRDVTYDHLVVEGRLLLEQVFDEPYPAGKFTPAATPGLF